MDWSPERVLNFGPVTHRRGLRWQKRTNLLWPVHAWQVVTPETKDSQLNLLQRAVLRFQMAGMRDASGIGALLGIDGELVLLVVAELRQMNLLTGSGAVSDGGARLLDESEQAIGETRVGWVFQDTWTGRLFPDSSQASSMLMSRPMMKATRGCAVVPRDRHEGTGLSFCGQVKQARCLHSRST